MKKTIVLSLLALLMASCAQKPTENKAIIHGQVLSGEAKQVKFEWIRDNPINGSGETYLAELDNMSQFSIDIPINRIATGRISVDGFVHDICFIPGDDLHIIVDADTIIYSGIGAEKNNYLYQLEINGLSDRAYYAESNRGELDPDEFLEAMIRFKQNRWDFLKKYRRSVKLQKEFVNLFEIETQVIFENLIREYPERYNYGHKTKLNLSELPSEYTRLKSFSNYTDDAKTVSSNYIHNLRNEIHTKAREISGANRSIRYEDAKYVALMDSLSGKTREYVLTNWILTDFSQNLYDSIAIEKFNSIEKDALSQETFTAGLKKYNEKQLLIGQPLHQEFSNTLLRDTSGILLTFGEMMEKHRGKVVYLDFWGVGCGPCIAAMPYSKKLQAKLSEEPIEFVFLCVQGINQDNWKSAFKMTLTDKNHYVLENGFNSRLHQFMQINWVPCHMIFDKQGRLSDFNANGPTEMFVEETLMSLAQQTFF